MQIRVGKRSIVPGGRERRFGVKVVIVNGQNHKGSTRMIARELAEKITTPEEITEFFLPRDFDKPFGHKHIPPVEPDYSYWEERGWHGKNRPWK